MNVWRKQFYQKSNFKTMENENNAIAPAAIPIEKLQSWLQATGNQVKLSEKEALQFLEIATAFNLNPFKREEKFDLIVSNPPYICTEDINRLEPEIRNYEPREALDGGKDGLGFYRKWIPKLPFLHQMGFGRYH